MCIAIHSGKGALQPAQIFALGEELGGEIPVEDLRVPEVLFPDLPVEKAGGIAILGHALGDAFLPMGVVKENVNGNDGVHKAPP